MSDPIMQVLGRIEGKLDAEIQMAKEHRDDDKRRFGEVYQKLGEHDRDIANAKGAKGVIVWLIGGGLVSLAGSVYALFKVSGKG
jgi:hypothetical protein